MICGQKFKYPYSQDNSNALPLGQRDRSNPRPMPRLPPPAGLTLIGTLHVTKQKYVNELLRVCT